jgi:hypothetical protein
MSVVSGAIHHSVSLNQIREENIVHLSDISQQGYTMSYLICCVRIPDNKLAILRRTDQMPVVCCPMHGINLGQVTTKAATRPNR